MSVYRVRLPEGAGAPDTVDEAAAESFSTGALDLRQAAGVSAEALAALRRQAEAFFAAGRHGPCLDVLLGLGALDDVAPRDASMMAECFWALGDPEAAEVCRLLHLKVLDAIEDAIGELELAS